MKKCIRAGLCFNHTCFLRPCPVDLSFLGDPLRCVNVKAVWMGHSRPSASSKRHQASRSLRRRNRKSDCVQNKSRGNVKQRLFCVFQQGLYVTRKRQSSCKNI
ncbi:hypothetical protein Q5P01_008496 [Channa striata]|uniref:Uncharacterized protein n=1 Tax=Channa striata TaxID=64152 RepID=A0AA88MZQ2_CHASR|nr:hypothetical protein Q5P01_008496 [Channa striata]